MELLDVYYKVSMQIEDEEPTEDQPEMAIPSVEEKESQSEEKTVEEDDPVPAGDESEPKEDGLHFPVVTHFRLEGPAAPDPMRVHVDFATLQRRHTFGHLLRAFMQAECELAREVLGNDDEPLASSYDYGDCMVRF